MRTFNLTISFIFFLTILSTSYGQTKDEAIFFDQTSLITKFHTIKDLENLKKGELINLYQERVKEIITVIPYLSLTNEAGVRLKDLGIKEDTDNLKTLRKSVDATKEALTVTNNSIEELVAYADTEKIVLTILYFEEIIKETRIGVNRNF